MGITESMMTGIPEIGRPEIMDHGTPELWEDLHGIGSL
jgi:hypothetical protein